MSNLFIQQLFTDPMGYFAWIVVIVFSICMHEYSHAAMALRMGDDTAARMGHLTLNPLRQMGIQSLAMLAIIGLAWGAVPVSPGHLSRKGRIFVSFAGPASNAALCLLFSLAAVVVHHFTQSLGGAVPVILLAASANGVLFLLNMLPVPGLDGWSVATGLFPAMERIRLTPALTLILFLLLIGSPLLSWIWAGGHLLSAIFFTIGSHLPGMG